jgi:hypothetical protein
MSPTQVVNMEVKRKWLQRNEVRTGLIYGLLLSPVTIFTALAIAIAGDPNVSWNRPTSTIVTTTTVPAAPPIVVTISNTIGVPIPQEFTPQPQSLPQKKPGIIRMPPLPPLPLPPIPEVTKAPKAPKGNGPPSKSTNIKEPPVIPPTISGPSTGTEIPTDSPPISQD